MTGDTSIKSAAEDRMTALCIGQAVVDCITRGLEDDPFGRGKTRAQSITLNLGGDAVNESFVLSSLGHSVGLMCSRCHRRINGSRDRNAGCQYVREA